MTRRAALLALTFALLGMIVSVAAAYTHYQLLADPSHHSFCDVSESISCTQRFLTHEPLQHGLGVPVAIFGECGLRRPPAFGERDGSRARAVRENVPGYLFALSTVALAVISLYLAYVPIVRPENVLSCLCLAMDAAVIGLFVVSGAATTIPHADTCRSPCGSGYPRASWQPARDSARRAVLVAGRCATLAFFPREGRGTRMPHLAADAPAPDRRSSEFERVMATARRGSDRPADRGREGDRSSTFNDFQCPDCRQSYLQYKAIPIAKYVAQQPGAVKFGPEGLSARPRLQCERHGRRPSPAACDAAVAVRLAQPHNSADALEEWLLRTSPRSTPPSVRKAALEVGQITDFDAKYSLHAQSREEATSPWALSCA